MVVVSMVILALRPTRANRRKVGCCEAIIAIFLPPLAVALRTGCGAQLLLNILLTILGWIPGVIHAWIVILAEPGLREQHKIDRRQRERTRRYSHGSHHSHHHHRPSSARRSHERVVYRSSSRGAPMVDRYGRPVRGVSPYRGQENGYVRRRY